VPDDVTREGYNKWRLTPPSIKSKNKNNREEKTTKSIKTTKETVKGDEKMISIPLPI
jgi:hypothetical protein